MKLLVVIIFFFSTSVFPFGAAQDRDSDPRLCKDFITAITEDTSQVYDDTLEDSKDEQQ